MLIFKSVLGFLILLAPLSILGQQEGFREVDFDNEFRSTFSQKTSNISTIQAEFQQEKFISYLSASVVSEGLFYYRKPNSIRWEFTNPYQYIIIVKNGAFHIQDSKEKTNFKDNDHEFFDHMNMLVQNSLSGNIFSEDQYKTGLMASDDKYKLTIIPLEEKIKSMIKKVDILLDKQSLDVQSLVIYESSGDNTLIVFRNKVYNKVIDNKLFQ